MDRKGWKVIFALIYFAIVLIITLIFNLGLLFYFLILFPSSIILFIRGFKMIKAIKTNRIYRFFLYVNWIDHVKNPAMYRYSTYLLLGGSILLFLASIFFLYLFIKSMI